MSGCRGQCLFPLTNLYPLELFTVWLPPAPRRVGMSLQYEGCQLEVDLPGRTHGTETPTSQAPFLNNLGFLKLSGGSTLQTANYVA
jgi:hypothetical protein